MGDFHQASPEVFSHAAAGAQCTTISVMAVIATSIKPPLQWTSEDVNAIVRQGDSVHLELLHAKDWPSKRLDAKLDVDEIPDIMTCRLGNKVLNANIGVLSDTFYCFVSELSHTLQSAVEQKQGYNFLLRMHGRCTAILYQQTSPMYSIFDPHARNSSGESDGEGAASIFHFTSMTDMLRYLNKQNAGKGQEQVDITPIDVAALSKIPSQFPECAPAISKVQTGPFGPGTSIDDVDGDHLTPDESCVANGYVHSSSTTERPSRSLDGFPNKIATAPVLISPSSSSNERHVKPNEVNVEMANASPPPDVAASYSSDGE
ncbi:hypothetical protein HOLleu_02875 [Holothuria leucospilota]|uniref:Uncharacterized protein n=1 Tax=Holothuria leucospilota TaxID=206669 RepID=A0A9Q1CRV8_HOLLE|nr:hypothetical protein HOLleu_02875 [Holothuria leucospilota]